MTGIDSAKSPPPPWGIVTTVLWALLAILLEVVAIAVALPLWIGKPIDPAQNLMDDGPALAVATLVSTLVQIGVLAAAARLGGWNPADYLGWTVPRRRDALLALAAIMAFVLAYDVLTYGLGRPVVTPFQVDTYRSAREAGSLVILWIVFVIAAPLGEELLFRGFLYRGFAPTRKAVIPAVVIISALWALIHVQYDWFGVLQIFLSGLILGWARWRSGSTMLTFAMHGLINTWAMLETVAQLEWRILPVS